MDEKLIDQILLEDVPEWEFEDFRFVKDKRLTNLTSDNLSVYTDGDEENESTSRMNSVSNFGGGVTASSTNDIMSIQSSTGTPIMSPLTGRRLPVSHLATEGNGDVTGYRSVLPHRTGRIIKHTVLTKVANQISTTKAQANMGFPVCCARGKYLAIGTSKGVTFLFDLKQVLKFYVGVEDASSNFGAVSSLSFNVGSTRLLVGFVKAHINMWDISGNDGKLLRSIDVNQGPGYAVSFVRFLPDPKMAVYADTNGSVFQLIFKRGIAGRSTDTECFFSGSRGEILCLESLFIPKHLKRHEMEEYSLLAMASFTKIIIVACKPQLKVKFMQSLKGKSETMPHLEWSWNTRLSDSDVPNNKHIFLTFARDTEIYILKISSQMKSTTEISLEPQTAKLKFDIVFHMSLDIQILSIKWMNSYFVGVIDFDENFHAIDLQTKSIIESLDIKSVQIVYNTSLFKSTATGGNVSEAMSVAAERACYHSVMELNGQIKILGQQEMHLMMLRPWKEAVDVARKYQGPEAAFKLCTELYKGKNLTCRQVLMLPSKDEDRQKNVVKVALDLIESTLAESLNLLDFHSFFDSMLNLCSVMKQISFFTDSVFNKIVNTKMEVAFLDSIILLILNNTVSTLHPEVVQRLVEYLQGTNQLGLLDSCITKLNISCIDLHQIINLATKEHLFSSFIHIHNSAFQDYLTPIEYMIGYISDSRFSNSENEIHSETVIKAIVYIHCCFAGKDFFTGEALSSNITEEITTKIFEYLIPFDSNSDMTSLNVLLEYNTNEFLNMITLAFDEPFFTSDIGITRKQAVLQRLCHFFISDKMLSSKLETIRFFIFLSRELNKATNISVYIDQVILDQLVERVCLGLNDSSDKHEQKSLSNVLFLHKQAENAFLSFLKSNSAYRDHWLKNERILNLSRKAQFYRVCEFIYRRKKMLHMVLECFLLDPDYRMESFELIESAWNDENVDDNQRCQMIEKCFQLAESLILANPTLSVIVLLTICKKRLDEVINKLGGSQTDCDSERKNIFNFLKAFFVIRNELEETDNCIKCPISVSSGISNTLKSVKVHSQVSETFIDLLCKFEPSILQIYLKYSVDYRNENAITIVSKYNLPYALGFLYEKTKRFDLAAKLYINIFNKLWTNFTEMPDLKLENCNISSSSGKPFQLCMDTFIHLVKKHKSNSTESEIFWSHMLNSILDKQISSKSQPYESMIEVIFMYFVKYLSQEVAMSTIMVKILKNPVFTGENFGKVRELVISMMNSFNYEQILLESCIALVDNDVSSCLIQLKTIMSNGVMVGDPQCSICMKNLIYMPREYSNYNILTFRCGHRFHVDCLALTRITVDEQSKDIQDLTCSLCSANRDYYMSINHKLLGRFKQKTPNVEDLALVQTKSANGTPENIKRTRDLNSRDKMTVNSTSEPHQKNIINFVKTPKTDVPVKLNLAPPNYLLNFCTME